MIATRGVFHRRTRSLRPPSRRSVEVVFVTENWLSSLEESRLRLLALEGLVDTIKSLLAWTKRAQQNIIQRKSEADAAMLALANSGYESDEEKDADTSLTSTNSNASHRQTPSSRFTALATPTPSNAGGSPDDGLVPSFSMQQFHFLRQQKAKLDTGILRFNMKPKKGLVYLEQHGILHADNPKEIAEFFHQNVGTLDKITVGEYMGEESELNKQVLYAYTERFDFHHCSFDEAIRKFLNGFWLPGEAQKIDRMMEKFAEVYHRHNPGIFSSADTAYVLAYSVIMLNTDAHKAGIKHRMTKEEFFKNTRGIDDGKDVDPVFLGDIYDRITTNEIKMKVS